MKNQIIISLLSILIFNSCSRKTYLSIAENEISNKIENSLVCNEDKYYNELQNYFEQYILKNGMITDSENIGQGYYNYLNFVRTQGSGLDKIENNSKTNTIKEKLSCSGYSLTFEKNTGFWNNWLVPTVSKYKMNLIKEGETDELIYRMGTSDLSEKSDAGIVLDGILEMYKPSDFERPVLKKIIILDWFVPLEMGK